MSRFIKTKAIIINTYPIRETDRIITFISETGAKSQGIAKGVRKINSSFSGKLELFNHVRLFLVKGRNLDIITQAELINTYKNFYNNLTKLICGMQILSSFNKLLEYKENSKSKYYLLKSILSTLNNSGQPEAIVKFAELKLINLLGYKPQIDKCINCQTGDYEYLNFSAYLGGVVCDNCQTNRMRSLPKCEIETIKLYKATLKYLKFISANSFRILGRMRVSEVVLKQLGEIIGQQLQMHFSIDYDKNLIKELIKIG